MTKTKKLVAVLAALAVGTTMAAGVALAGNEFGIVANATTADGSTETVGLGTSTLTIAAGASATYDLGVSHVGTYGFTWISGSATFEFAGIYNVVEEDAEESETDEPEETVTYSTHGLNSNLTSFYITVEAIDSPTVTITALESTQISFSVEYLIDIGTNEVALTANTPQTFNLNAKSAGYYEVKGLSGSASITFSGVGSYTVSESGNAFTVVLSNPENTTVTLSSNANVTVKFSITYTVDITNLVVGNNTIAVSSTAVSATIFNSITETEGGETVYENAAAGYYTFTKTSSTSPFAVISFSINGTTYAMNMGNSSFVVYIMAPSASVITISSTVETTVSFTITYSQNDPNATTNTLSVGTQTVNATGEGEEYVLTSVTGGTYTLDCTDENAYIMVETEYGAEQILITYDDEWNEVYETYTFTLGAGESITFYMSTMNWGNDTYDVTIAAVEAN